TLFVFQHSLCLNTVEARRAALLDDVDAVTDVTMKVFVATAAINRRGPTTRQRDMSFRRAMAGPCSYEGKG
ncbi:hypothetical protein, partial [Bradyrhizobium lablabi]|uniref:hypothetical protein n=1 Tax=Bradyrhizobium lablabi TaxID=722472 RepID=UPI001BA82092